MAIQWDTPEGAEHFIRIVETEARAWDEAADAIQALLPGLADVYLHEAERRIHECRARGEALRKLVRHILEGDYQ
jgi:hypothetical protein